MNGSLPADTYESSGTAGAQSLDLAVDSAALAAASRIAPLWPLDSFVAVNPLMGIAEKNLAGAGHLMAHTSGARLTMPRHYYAEKIETGRIRDEDIARAISEMERQGKRHVTSVQRVRAEALKEEVGADVFRLPTVASLAARQTGTNWDEFIIGCVSNWAADYFDQGVAAWSAAGADADPWTSYRAVATIERSAEFMGLDGARDLFAELPAEPTALLVMLARELGLSADALELYFHRLLADVAGWAAFARYRGWTSELRGEDGSAARQMLAIRAAWELVLYRRLGDTGLAARWQASRGRYGEDDADQWTALNWTDLVLQTALDFAAQRELAESLPQGPVPTPQERPDVQAIFCIDVRSERYRRVLEQAPDLQIETLGFAGFFGLALKLESSLDGDSARCPVLLEPGHSACVNHAPGLERSKLASGHWARFQRRAVSGFSYVEALGVGYAWKLLKASLGLGSAAAEAPSPVLDATLREKINMAEGLLRGMSLTTRFARLVVLAGHGASTVNNPYASALDCGACGGHAGDANARVAAALLNDRFVRAGLIERGIDIPADTQFVAALHDTTTDDLRILADAETEMTDELQRLQTAAAMASEQARRERAQTLAAASSRDLKRRATDWSQVRPEWGLAGCRAFIAAPRARSSAMNLAGRAFLHEYDHSQDKEYGVLETILTAPLVVASWITMQYYGSTVDNLRFGSGDKTLHNVVGGIGVYEGVGGDLRTGLPLQSLHDGAQYVHEPLRLMAVVAAPTEAIDYVIFQHDALAQLVDNGWIQMHALDDQGVLRRRPQGGGDWEVVSPATDAVSGRSEAA